jgi:hypothetical protein
VIDPLVIDLPLLLLFLFQLSLLLCLLLHEAIQFLLVEVFIDLVLVVELILLEGGSVGGLGESECLERYWKCYCYWSKESWLSLSMARSCIE